LGHKPSVQFKRLKPSLKWGSTKKKREVGFGKIFTSRSGMLQANLGSGRKKFKKGEKEGASASKGRIGKGLGWVEKKEKIGGVAGQE